MELYRPLRADEYRAVEALDFKGFPPARADQPLFSVLLSEEGAVQIASRMRLAKTSESTVYVVSFAVDDAYIRQFPVHKGVSREREALWIPAEELEILNQHLIGKIQVISMFEIDRSDGDVFFA